LRRALKKEGRDLHAEFIRMLPEPPRPMKVRLWSPRRAGLWALVIVLALIMTQPLLGVYGEETAADSHLGVSSLNCAGDLEPLWLVAQAVPTASAVPCVETVPDGWRFSYATANRNRASFSFDHDRAGYDALRVRLAAVCRPPSDIHNSDFNETVQRPIPGGCIIARIRSPRKPAVYQEVRSQLNLMLGSVSRAELRAALDRRTDGRLHLEAP
jgi:hypothetical protein